MHACMHVQAAVKPACSLQPVNKDACVSVWPAARGCAGPRSVDISGWLNDDFWLTVTFDPAAMPGPQPMLVAADVSGISGGKNVRVDVVESAAGSSDLFLSLIHI